MLTFMLLFFITIKNKGFVSTHLTKTIFMLPSKIQRLEVCMVSMDG